MARPLRIQFPGAWYHVMNRGINHAGIFRTEQDRQLFCKTLGDAVDLWRIRIHAYNLIPNHYHLLVETPLGNLSRAMRHVDHVYTQRFNKQHRRDGPLLRGRYKAILVEQETYLLELVRYIHFNGVAALLYPSAQEDPHCSHPAYLDIAPRPAWLTTETVLAQFHQQPEKAQRLLDAFVNRGVPPELADHLNKKRWPAALGSSGFLKHIREKHLPSKSDVREQPQMKDMRKQYTPNQILEKVAVHYRIPLNSFIQRNSAKNNQPRKIAMYLMRTACLLPYQEIGKHLGGVGRGAVAPACLKIKQEISKWEPLLNQILQDGQM